MKKNGSERRLKEATEGLPGAPAPAPGLEPTQSFPPGRDAGPAPTLETEGVTEELTDALESGPGTATDLVQDGPLDEGYPTETLKDGAETGEVYVILPEGQEANVPVVETEAVDDDTDMGAPAGAFPPAPSPSDAKDLEALAEEIDDEILRGEPEPAAPSRSTREAFSAGLLQETKKIRGRGSRGPVRVLLPLAAALLLGIAGFFTYPQWRGFVGLGVESTGTSVAHAGGTPQGAEGGGKAVDPQGGHGGTKVDPAGGASKGPQDPTVASSQAFREKVLLAIELGFVGEVGND